MGEKKTVKERIREKKLAAKQKVKNTVDWCGQHPEVVSVFGPAIIGSTVEIIKVVARRHNLSEERALKDRYIYDQTNRHYYEMRRKPKSSEWLQIDHRRQNGEPVGWILNDMRLLK